MQIHDLRADLTVGELRKALESLPDDTRIVGIDGHSGEEDNIRFYDESDAECPGPSKDGETVLVVMLG